MRPKTSCLPRAWLLWNRDPARREGLLLVVQMQHFPFQDDEASGVLFAFLAMRARPHRSGKSTGYAAPKHRAGALREAASRGISSNGRAVGPTAISMAESLFRSGPKSSLGGEEQKVRHRLQRLYTKNPQGGTTLACRWKIWTPRVGPRKRESSSVRHKRGRGAIAPRRRTPVSSA